MYNLRQITVRDFESHAVGVPQYIVAIASEKHKVPVYIRELNPPSRAQDGIVNPKDIIQIFKELFQIDLEQLVNQKTESKHEKDVQIEKKLAITKRLQLKRVSGRFEVKKLLTKTLGKINRLTKMLRDTNYL